MTPLRLYLTDDDNEDRELFIEALRELEVETEITQFDNGVDLMADLFSDKELPDAIFLDLYMPIMDGFECLADIRSFSKFSEIQVIVFSSYYRKREVNQLKLDGANQYLQKPNSFEQMKSILAKSLRLIKNDAASEKGPVEFIAIS